MMDQAVKIGHRPLIENKSQIVLMHCSSGHKHALEEILQDPSMQLKLSDTKYAKEIITLDQFYKMLGSDPARAFYGLNYVLKASEKGAIETLMMMDSLFRY